MRIRVYLFLLLIIQYSFTDELFDDNYYDFESSEGITVYGDIDKYEKENKIIEILNKSQEERETFIEEELLIKSGFRKTGNIKFRKTTGEEKIYRPYKEYFMVYSELFQRNHFLKKNMISCPGVNFIIFIPC